MIIPSSSLEKDLQYLRLAIEEAKTAMEHEEVPIGAVIVRGDEILARAHNKKESENDPVGHAEVIAIKRAAKKSEAWRLSGATLYTTLEPCPLCLYASLLSRLDRVVFAAEDKKGGALSLEYRFHEDDRLNHRFTVDHVPIPEAGEILSAFFKKKRSFK